MTTSVSILNKGPDNVEIKVVSESQGLAHEKFLMLHPNEQHTEYVYANRRIEIRERDK